MKLTHFLKRFLVGLALVTFIAGCNGPPKEESSTAYLDDATITTMVKADILKDPTLQVQQINVESNKGEVELSGFVDSKQSSEKAVQVATAVEGVKAVTNSLVIK